MRPGARLNAAVEILTEILERHRPAADGLAEWGRTHRFAGSGDRAAIGNLVYDALRRRQSLAARMGSDSARAMVIGAAHVAFGMTIDEIAAAADGAGHSLAPLTPQEREALARPTDPNLPAHIRGDFPEWLAPSMTRAFGERAGIEGEALASRAPVDLRVNTLKADREKVLKALERVGAPRRVNRPLKTDAAEEVVRDVGIDDEKPAVGLRNRKRFDVIGAGVARACTHARPVCQLGALDRGPRALLACLDLGNAMTGVEPTCDRVIECQPNGSTLSERFGGLQAAES